MFDMVSQFQCSRVIVARNGRHSGSCYPHNDSVAGDVLTLEIDLMLASANVA